MLFCPALKAGNVSIAFENLCAFAPLRELYLLILLQRRGGAEDGKVDNTITVKAREIRLFI